MLGKILYILFVSLGILYALGIDNKIMEEDMYGRTNLRVVTPLEFVYTIALPAMIFLLIGWLCKYFFS